MNVLAASREVSCHVPHSGFRTAGFQNAEPAYAGIQVLDSGFRRNDAASGGELDPKEIKEKNLHNISIQDIIQITFGIAHPLFPRTLCPNVSIPPPVIQTHA